MTPRRPIAILGFALLAGACAAPQQEASAPEEILFGFDREPFDAEGLDTIASIARSYRGTGASGVLVVGHADRSGDPDYNRTLSERRALIVADDLIARGVPAAAVTMESLGETELARDTADGVRAQPNRRVTVALIGGEAYRPPLEDAPYRLPLPPAAAVED